MSQESRTCATCAFSILQKLPPPELGEFRQCRFAPPQAFAFTRPHPKIQGAIELKVDFIHPRVNDAQWCFQHISVDAMKRFQTDAPADLVDPARNG